MQKGEFDYHALQVHACRLSRTARMHNVCRILKESSKGPESVSGYNIEMVCERLAIGDTVLHKQIATLHES